MKALRQSAVKSLIECGLGADDHVIQVMADRNGISRLAKVAVRYGDVEVDGIEHGR